MKIIDQEEVEEAKTGIKRQKKRRKIKKISSARCWTISQTKSVTRFRRGPHVRSLTLFTSIISTGMLTWWTPIQLTLMPSSRKKDSTCDIFVFCFRRHDRYFEPMRTEALDCAQWLIKNFSDKCTQLVLQKLIDHVNNNLAFHRH